MKNKPTDKPNINLIVEEGEIIAWEENNLVITYSLAERIWKLMASVKGKESALKVPKKKRHEYAMMGAKAAKEVKNK